MMLAPSNTVELQERPLRVVVLIGHVPAYSRIREFSLRVSDLIIERLGVPATSHLVEAADFGVDLFARGSSPDHVQQALSHILEADVLLVSTPVRHGTFSGALSLLLDRLPTDALRGVRVFAVLLDSQPPHHVAAGMHLRAVLENLGAIVHGRGIAVAPSKWSDSNAVIEDWLDRNFPRSGGRMHLGPASGIPNTLRTAIAVFFCSC